MGVIFTYSHICFAHTRGSLQAMLYYSGMLAYFWLLATPAVGLVFGIYLFLSVCYAGV